MALFDCVSESVKGKKFRRGFRLVWHTVVWFLWRARNNVIFNGVVMEPKEIVEDIKVLSWRWSVNCLKITPFFYFYEWCCDPGDFFALRSEACCLGVGCWGVLFFRLPVMYFSFPVCCCCGIGAVVSF
jgi:hypothetical protein